MKLIQVKREVTFTAKPLLAIYREKAEQRRKATFLVGKGIQQQDVMVPQNFGEPKQDVMVGQNFVEPSEDEKGKAIAQISNIT